MLLTTHYMFEADALCDRIAVVAKGRVVAAGTPRDLKESVAEGTVVEIEVYGIDAAAVEGLGFSLRRRVRSLPIGLADREPAGVPRVDDLRLPRADRAAARLGDPALVGADADVSRHLRLFAIGGSLSYRALFGWINPYLFVIVLLIPSVTQIVFFAYLGRAAGVEDDTFYVVGNAVVTAAVPCLFGMSQAITDERYTHTLSLLVVSPASRVTLYFLRRFELEARRGASLELA